MRHRYDFKLIEAGLHSKEAKEVQDVRQSGTNSLYFVCEYDIKAEIYILQSCTKEAQKSRCESIEFSNKARYVFDTQVVYKAY